MPMNTSTPSTAYPPLRTSNAASSVHPAEGAVLLSSIQESTFSPSAARTLLPGASPEPSKPTTKATIVALRQNVITNSHALNCDDPPGQTWRVLADIRTMHSHQMHLCPLVRRIDFRVAYHRHRASLPACRRNTRPVYVHILAHCNRSSGMRVESGTLSNGAPYRAPGSVSEPRHQPPHPWLRSMGMTTPYKRDQRESRKD